MVWRVFASLTFSVSAFAVSFEPSKVPPEFAQVARDLNEVAEGVLASQNRCVSKNAFGAFVHGGGCNKYGCWPAGGSCNAFGCTLSGECNLLRCPARISPFECEASEAENLETELGPEEHLNVTRIETGVGFVDIHQANMAAQMPNPPEIRAD